MEHSKNNFRPILRFTEFIEDGDWLEKSLGDLSEYENGKAHEQDIDAKGKYIVVNSKFISTDGTVKKFTDNPNCLAKKNEILMVLSDVPKGKAIAKCFYVDKNLTYTVNQRICKLTPQNVDGKFVYYLLNRNPYLLSYDDGVKQTNLRIEDVLSCPLAIPPGVKEQQKIASFLSNIDELIANHRKKLQSLQRHRTSLMQALFPKEGEKLPKFRFEEFSDNGGWIKKKLGQIGTPLMCKRIFKDQTTVNAANAIPFYKIGTFGQVADSYISTELYEKYRAKYAYPKKGEILISASGTIGRLVVFDGEPAYFQDSNIIWLGHDERYILNSFLVYCYIMCDWQTSDGGVIKRLYNSDLKSIQILIPKSKLEQEKIASCLSGLDDLVNLQSEKIEQLKKHKKGLMQGLFPRIDG